MLQLMLTRVLATYCRHDSSVACRWMEFQESPIRLCDPCKLGDSIFLALRLPCVASSLQVQIHEPILVAPEGPELRSIFEATFADFSKVNISINLVTYYDDVGEAYPWVVKLPVSFPIKQQSLSEVWSSVMRSSVSC